MSDLTRREKRQLEEALGMEGGYVLDFSNRTFQAFFQDVLGIDIYEDRFERSSGSKANRMRAFWDLNDNESVATVLKELAKDLSKNSSGELLLGQLSDLIEIAERLLTSSEKSTTSALSGVSDPARAEATDDERVPVAFISYKWESDSHLQWVRTLASNLRGRGVDAKLDQWEVQPGDSFTDYMQRNLSAADVILFVITDEAVRAAEAPEGRGGALKFEVQMMNARRIAEGTRIIGIYRSGERPPHYLRDHRYIDFRDDSTYDEGIRTLVDTILGQGGPPPVVTSVGSAFKPPTQPIVTVNPVSLADGGELTIQVTSDSNAPIVWLNRSLDGPNGNIYGGGSTWIFEQLSPGVWSASWTEVISPWAPSGTYILSGVSVKNAAELESANAHRATFEVRNSRDSGEPVIESVVLSSHRIPQGGAITISLCARSSAPVKWLDKTLDGPRGNIYGGGGTARFQAMESNLWRLEWKEEFSEWTPIGRYILSGLSVRSEAQLSSESWPATQFEIVAKQ